MKGETKMRSNDNSSAVVTVIGIIIAIFIILICHAMNDTEWNNGYCSCGGNWVYQQAVGHRYDTMYLYECDKCGKTYEFYEKR